MATQLNTKPGINGANVLSIPTEWDATWFRHFIHNSLKGADVRNAVGTGGIKVTGNISSPYATIDGSGIAAGVTQIIAGTGITISPVGGTGAVTITNAAATQSVVGTANEIAVSTAGGVSTISFAPNIAIPAPPSGNALIVNGAVGSDAGEILGSSSTGNSFGALIAAGTTAGDNPLRVFNQSFGALMFSVNGIGQVLVGAPTTAGGTVFIQSNGGAAITLNNSTGGGGIVQEATGVPTLVMKSPGALLGQIGSNGTQTWFLGSGASPLTNGTAALQWNATGNITVPAATSGTSLTVAAGAGGQAAIFNGVSASYPVEIISSPSFTNNSFGLIIAAGTSTSDNAVRVLNAAQNLNLFQVFGDGSVVVGAPTGGAQGIGTINATGYYLNGVAISTGKVISVSFTGLAAGGAITGSVNAGSPSYVRNAAGDYTITWAPGFTPVAASVTSGAVSDAVFKVVTLSSTTLRVQVANSATAALQDTGAIYVIAQ